MTVFVDPLFATARKKNWPYDKACHMTTDGDIEELHQFAQRLGLKREWFQGHSPNYAMHHYDLTEAKRRQALALGAKEITRQEFSVRVMAIAQLLREQKERVN